MRTLSTTLQNETTKSTVSIATCWRITRQDGEVYRLTDADDDIFINGYKYEANKGFTPSSYETKEGLSVTNAEFDGILDRLYISRSSIQSGQWDMAKLDIFIVSRDDPQEEEILISGYMGDIEWTENGYTAEVTGLTQILNQTLTRSYTSKCDADLGDNRCKLSISFDTGFKIVSIDDNDPRRVCTVDTDKATGFYTNGVIAFTSGNNDGVSAEVKSHTNNGDGTSTLAFYTPVSFTLNVDDTLDLKQGCDKHYATCRDTFNNTINFRGFPHIPGEQALQKGDS